MPTYEYACSACGHKFEQFQSIMAKPLTACPACKKRKVQRLISAGAGFIFKGSGFYITDYRSDSYKDAAKKDSAPVAATATAAAPASDSAKSNGSKSESSKQDSTKPAPAKSEPAPSRSTSAAKSTAKSRM